MQAETFNRRNTPKRRDCVSDLHVTYVRLISKALDQSAFELLVKLTDMGFIFKQELRCSNHQFKIKASSEQPARGNCCIRVRRILHFRLRERRAGAGTPSLTWSASLDSVGFQCTSADAPAYARTCLSYSHVQPVPQRFHST